MTLQLKLTPKNHSIKITFVQSFNQLKREDSYRHKGLRKRLVDTLKQKGIKDQGVLDAIGKLPRHFFLDPAFDYQAYEDKALPILCDQTISQPYTVAYMTELLEVKKHDKILELGTGSGYQAAILALMGATVYTVERQETLHHEARKLLLSMGLTGIKFFYRDGSKGLPEFAPYDKIIVTAACTELPEVLLNQLKIGGILIIPVGEKTQQMLKIIRTGESDFKKTILEDFKFVPFLEGTVKRN